jgi:hypothetical protein
MGASIRRQIANCFPRKSLLKYYLEKSVLWYSVDSQKDLETVRSEFASRKDML